jgi:hypothetical protein
MAVNIPQIGDELGYHVMAFTFGVASDSPDVEISSSTGAQALVNINDVNVQVMKVETQVVKAFDGATTLAFTIGDDVDSDGYWTDTLVRISSTRLCSILPPLRWICRRTFVHHTDTIDLVVTGGMTAVSAKMRITYLLGAILICRPMLRR